MCFWLLCVYFSLLFQSCFLLVNIETVSRFQIKKSILKMFSLLYTKFEVFSYFLVKSLNFSFLSSMNCRCFRRRKMITFSCVFCGISRISIVAISLDCTFHQYIFIFNLLLSLSFFFFFQAYLSGSVEQKGTRVLLFSCSHEPSIYHPIGCSYFHLRKDSSRRMG